jgi:peptide/nickel transport system permease protein
MAGQTTDLTDPGSTIGRIENVVRLVYGAVTQDRMTTVYFGILSVIFFMGVLGPLITPYGYQERLYTEGGELLRSHPPSLMHPLGTTEESYDTLSRLLYGARPTVITGLLGGGIIISIGGSIGLVAGYFGGWIDNVLMRITDFMYGVPMIPFAIVLLALFGMGFTMSIVVIGLILWRSSARVIRSQVLQIKQRSFVQSARATGASDIRIVLKYILPNVAPMMALMFAMGLGYAIIVQASLAFVGVVDPFVPSWGVMLRNAYDSGYMGIALWWSLPPGLLISLTVLSSFMFGRKIAGEENQNSAIQ